MFYHQNALGSVAALSDAAGGIVEAYRYDAYGAHYRLTPTFPATTVQFNGSDTVTAGTASLFDNPYLFTGRRFDPESGRLYYRNRYYDAACGRFLSHDPIGPFGDPSNLGNPYAYVGNMPASASDPFGLFLDWIQGQIDGSIEGQGSNYKACGSGLSGDALFAQMRGNGNSIQQVRNVGGSLAYRGSLEAVNVSRAVAQGAEDLTWGVAEGGLMTVLGVAVCVRHPVRTIEGLGAIAGTIAGNPQKAIDDLNHYLLNLDMGPREVGKVIGGLVAGGGIAKAISAMAPLSKAAYVVERCALRGSKAGRVSLSQTRKLGPSANRAGIRELHRAIYDDFIKNGVLPILVWVNCNLL